MLRLTLYRPMKSLEIVSKSNFSHFCELDNMVKSFLCHGNLRVHQLRPVEHDQSEGMQVKSV